MKKCPQCDVDVDLADPSVLMDQMGHDWHESCWEAFVAEYNDVLDGKDLKFSQKWDDVPLSCYYEDEPYCSGCAVCEPED